MVPRSHMGRLLCPKTLLKNKIQANSQKSGKLQVALAHPCVFPIALRALVALFPLFGVARWLHWPPKWARLFDPPFWHLGDDVGTKVPLIGILIPLMPNF